MSKCYNMAGWRVGYCLGDPRMIGALIEALGNVNGV
ncbi:MAG: aminotransferase class I/II-fold pyridoxal phosphate-dependent enzyme [Bryobacteraceae bacterium]|jgi:aspartate/methionine/tyrosine aminotransferase